MKEMKAMEIVAKMETCDILLEDQHEALHTLADALERAVAFIGSVSESCTVPGDTLNRARALLAELGG